MNLGNRNSQYSFAQTPAIQSARSLFDRSFAAKDTMNFDELTPMYIDEVLPGDTINLNVSTFMRLAPQVRPLMDNMYVDFFFFFVPNRILWAHWEQFMGAEQTIGPDPTPTTLIEPVVISPNGADPVPVGWPVGSRADHFGLPTDVPGISVRALPFRAYVKIYNDWFRAQDFEAKLTEYTDDGPDPAITAYDRPLTSYKKHDYFTSALPWPQKGAAVGIPTVQSLTPTMLPVVSNEEDILLTDSALADRGLFNLEIAGQNTAVLGGAGVGGTPLALQYGSESGLVAQLSGSDVQGILGTMNQLRTAMQMQVFLERDARNGTRYIELLRAHWGVISPDFRLQRPELLSMSTIKIGQNVVAQTSEPTEQSPQANLSAYSTASASGQHIGFSKSMVEHGFVIGLCRARADITYQQGVNKFWSRITRFDHFWPEFQQVGEQAINGRELFAQGSIDPEDDASIVGYQERYSEYKYRPSEIKGQFRSTYAETLDVWHLAQEFETLPTLNLGFLKSFTPIERALVQQDDENYPHLLVDYFYQLRHARIMLSRPVPAGFGRL